MNFQKTKKIFLSLLLIVPIFFISGCTKETEVTYSTDLEIWGIFDDSDAFSDLFGAYRKINPFVQGLQYRKFTLDTYKEDLLDALATGNPPDIFYIQSTWLSEFQDKIEPADPAILGEAEFRTNFVDVVSKDALSNGRVYGAPLSVDSLALYYNKDLFNYEAITAPPKTWTEFNTIVNQLVKKDSFGQITQAGAAMGTADNINRSPDILQALWFQAGLDVLSTTSEKRIFLGTAGDQVMSYYTQFARGNNVLYTWNPRMHYSIDAFTEGNLGMMINYSWQYNTIKRKNAKMNFAVVPLPQSENGTMANFSNYWMLVVAKNKFDTTSPNPQLKNEVRLHEAWQLIKYLTVNQKGQMNLTNKISGAVKAFPLTFDPAESYLEKTKKPAARFDLIEKQKSDPILAPFATGNLIAKSWRQPDGDEVERIIADAINGVNIGKYSVSEANRLIESRVGVLLQK